METFLDLVETGTREEFLDSIVEACENYGFTMGDEIWGGNTIFIKIKAGRVSFDIIADYDVDNEEFSNIRYSFDETIKAYHIDSVLKFDGIEEVFKTSFGYETGDRKDALNSIGEYFDAIIAYDEGSFIIYGDGCKAVEDRTFNEMEWFTIANMYGEL